MIRTLVSVPRPPTGIVARPKGRGSSHQTLVFFCQEVRELLGGHDNHPFSLASVAVPLTGGAAPGGEALALRNSRCPVYDPATGCVYFAEGEAVFRLDERNVVSLVAGRRDQAGSVDGVGRAALFDDIRALTVDGRGAIYVAEPDCIRRISLCGEAPPADGVVTTLRDSTPVLDHWVGLAYLPYAEMLLASTCSALCRVPLLRTGSSKSTTSTTSTSTSSSGSGSPE
ncbi:hypothetical protein TSOC_013809, partial [Tetrabaena socialis]